MVRTAIPLGPEFRVYRQAAVLPPSFNEWASPRRTAETVEWERATIRPRHALPLRVPMLNAPQNVSSAEYEILLHVARQHNRRNHHEGAPDPSILDLLGARTALVGAARRIQFDAHREVAEGMYLSHRPNALPRAWIVHQAVTVPTFRSRSPRAIERFTRELMFPDNAPHNWREVAVVETDHPLEFVPAGQHREEEFCQIDSADPQRVEIDVRLSSPGLVVLADQIFPGWELTVETNGTQRDLPILRTNRVFRGTVLPAGTHRLVYRYRPNSFYLGAAISGLTCCLLLGATIIVAGRRRDS